MARVGTAPLAGDHCMKKNSHMNEANGVGESVSGFTKALNEAAEYETDPLDWWRDVVDVAAGSNHGLRVGVISTLDGELVEIFGELPVPTCDQRFSGP